MVAPGRPREKFPLNWRALYATEYERCFAQVWLGRRRPLVRVRILKMNPNFYNEFGKGIKIRGWHPASAREHGLQFDCTTLRQFHERWGVYPERKKSNKHHFLKSGRRKFVSWTLYMEGPGCDI